MSYDNLSSVSQNVLKFYQQLTGEERRIPFIFDDFHFCHSRVITLMRGGISPSWTALVLSAVKTGLQRHCDTIYSYLLNWCCESDVNLEKF
jgi:hypothetical protein